MTGSWVSTVWRRWRRPFVELSRRQFDVFLSYRSRDRGRVSALAESLEKYAGLRVFVDRWYLAPGQQWLPVLERALESCRAAAICVGPGELGPWQQREMCVALDRQARDPDFRVIPVLLPGAEPVLGFLGTNMWIDLRSGIGNDEFSALLVAAIRGAPPSPEVAEVFQRARKSVCPYRGLLHFREEDASFFLGREPIVDELERTLARAPLVAVVGASGSGKSSVVRAGLVPRLRRSHAPIWEVVTMVPGDRPLRGLAAAFVPLLEPEMTDVELLVQTSKLASALKAGEISIRDIAEWVLTRQSGSERVLLVLDQWEELYTLTHDAEERSRFVGQLLDATSHGVLSVVFTLRGDFVGQLLADRQLADRLQGAQVNVGPMTELELRQAIEEPAHVLGLSFEPGLVDLILSDVGGEPGHLPLLEFVLHQLWDQRQGNELLHQAYREIGGLEGAIASRAERVFESLSEPERGALRQLFLRLARPGEGQDYTRLRAVSTDISEEEWRVVYRLANERLLVTAQNAVGSDPTVEVSHEALLRHWRRLKTWLDRDREFLLWRERLRTMMNAWSERQEDDEALLHGAFLVEAEKWRIERNTDIGPSEHRYVDASVQARIRRENEAREQASRLEASERAGRRVLAQMYAESGRQLLFDGHAQEAIPCFLAARQNGLDELPLRMLFETARRQLPLVPSLEHRDRVLGAAFGPDGTRVVTASLDGTACVWDATTGKAITRFVEHESGVLSAAFSSDGTRVVTASLDKTARVWDAFSFQPLTLSLVHQDAVLSAAFSPNGTGVVTASLDCSAYLWNAVTGTLLTNPLVHQAAVVSVAFSPDGTRVVTASLDNTARVWDVATGALLISPLEHQAALSSAAFSPDGTRVVTASFDNTARVWDAATGRPLTDPIKHQATVMSVAFSPDGTRVVTASYDTSARVWDAVTGMPLTIPLEHQLAVMSAAFSPDGTRVVTASHDTSARIWDAVTGKPLTSSLEHQDEVMSASFSPDGTCVVTASYDRSVRVWDAVNGKPLTHPLEHQEPVVSAAFSPDGMRIVSASFDNTAQVWDVRPDMGTLQDWSNIAERSPFVLEGGVLVRRSKALESSY